MKFVTTYDLIYYMKNITQITNIRIIRLGGVIT